MKWQAKHSGGFTLVEILVAVTIGLFLTAGMIQMYISNRQSFRFNQELARIQENGRLALTLMAADVRMADFWGCSGGENVASLINTASTDYDPTVHDFLDEASTDFLAGLTGGDDGAGDSITVRGATGTQFVVQGIASGAVVVPGTQTAVEKAICGFDDCVDNSVADMALVTDCEDGDIFQVTSVAAGTPTTRADIGFNDTPPSGTPGNLTPASLTKGYDTTATFYTLRATRYHIASGTNGAPALFRAENVAGVGDEIAEGIQNMQITYGEDTDGDGTANRYVTASDLTTPDDWNAVVSVRVSLLLTSSEDGITDSPQVYSFNGGSVTATDRRLYQTMSATVTIRNRAP